MGLVSNDLGDWLAEAESHHESETLDNPFGVGAERAAMAQVHALWLGAGRRLHRWLDPKWDPDAEHEDGLTR